MVSHNSLFIRAEIIHGFHFKDAESYNDTFNLQPDCGIVTLDLTPNLVELGQSNFNSS